MFKWVAADDVKNFDRMPRIYRISEWIKENDRSGVSAERRHNSGQRSRLMNAAVCRHAATPAIFSIQTNKILPCLGGGSILKTVFARAHGVWTYEPREGRNAATAVCSTSAVVSLAF